jgi:hypothetical protein
MVRKRNTKPEQLGKLARDNAFELATLAAQRVENAAAELYKTAHFATYSLTVLSHQMSYQDSNAVVAIAQQKTSWPVLLGPHPDSQKKAQELIERLQVGAKTRLDFAGKPFNWDRDHQRPARAILACRHSNRGIGS